MFKKNVDSIVAGLSDIVSKLDTLTDASIEEVAELNASMNKLADKRDATQKEGDRSARIARKLAEIIK